MEIIRQTRTPEQANTNGAIHNSIAANIHHACCVRSSCGPLDLYKAYICIKVIQIYNICLEYRKCVYAYN